MTPETINYFFGTTSVRLPTDTGVSLVKERTLRFEVDLNSDDIKRIMQVIYERQEMDVDIPERSTPMTCRIESFTRAFKHSLDFWHCTFDLVIVPRLADLTKEQLEVIGEQVNRIKEMNDPLDTYGHNRSYIPLLLKQEAYNYQFGPVASLELINEHFYEIVSAYNLRKEEIIDLAIYVNERESQHQLRPPDMVNMFNEADEMDKESVNELLHNSRLRWKTNGREFLSRN